MANADRPQGARPKEAPARLREYTAGGTIYPGDFVHLEADGKVDAAAAGESLIGVAQSYATDGDKVKVWDDPQQIFVVQADGADIDAQTDIGLNYNIVATAGSTAYKASRMELDSDSGATTSTLPLKLLGIDERADNALGAQVDCLVKINNHILAAGTGTESAG